MDGNVVFDDKRTHDDWDLELVRFEIGPPAPIIKKIEIPGRNGALDLTEWAGQVIYEERQVKIILTGYGSYARQSLQTGSIAAYLQGAKRKMWLPSDPGYYYYGRFEIEVSKEDHYVHEYVISGKVDPFKYETVSSLEPWEWDSFSFETGIIREYASLTVDGSMTLLIPGTRMPVVPVIIAEGPDMEVSFNGSHYPLSSGENTIYSILLKEGLNTLVFTGNGTVSVAYRGGVL